MSTLVQNRALTVAAFARRWNVSEKTIYRAIARGEIACIRIGRSIRIPESALTPKETTE